jgi:hypothetical protein
MLFPKDQPIPKGEMPFLKSIFSSTSKKCYKGSFATNKVTNHREALPKIINNAILYIAIINTSNITLITSALFNAIEYLDMTLTHFNMNEFLE